MHSIAYSRDFLVQITLDLPFLTTVLYYGRPFTLGVHSDCAPTTGKRPGNPFFYCPLVRAVLPIVHILLFLCNRQLATPPPLEKSPAFMPLALYVTSLVCLHSIASSCKLRRLSDSCVPSKCAADRARVPDTTSTRPSLPRPSRDARRPPLSSIASSCQTHGRVDFFVPS